MTFALAVFASVAGGLVWCLLSGSSSAAWFLVLASAIWEPANNHHLEGKTLWTFTSGHGFTLADIYGLTGFTVATLALITADGWQPGDRVSASRRAAVSALIFGGGVVAAYVTG